MVIAVKGGTTITVRVPAGARVVVNDGRRKVSAIGIGFRISVTGVRVGDVYTAEKVQARGRVRPKPTPTPGDTVLPSVDSDVEVSPSASPDDDETPEAMETPAA